MADIEIKVDSDEAEEKMRTMICHMQQLNKLMADYIELFERANELYEKFKRPEVPIYIPYIPSPKPEPNPWYPGIWITEDSTADGNSVSIKWTLK